MSKLSEAPAVDTSVDSGSTMGTAPISEATNTLVSTMPELPDKVDISPAKALGLEELSDVRGAINGLIKSTKDKAGLGYDPIAKPEPKKAAAPKTSSSKASVAVAPSVNPASKVAAPAPVAKEETAKPSETDSKIAELQKQLEELRNQRAAPEPKKEEPVIQETPEQKAARDAEYKKAEQSYIADAASKVDFSITPEEVEAINAGGEDAVAAMSTINKRAIATALLEARKSIYNEINPALQESNAALGMLLDHHVQIVQHQARAAFSNARPDLVPHMSLAENVAQRLATGDQGKSPAHAQWWKSATEQQKLDEVAKQTEYILNERAKSLGYQDWKQVPAPAAAQPAITVAPPVPANIPEVKPATPVNRAPVKPPASHSPGASSVAGPAKNLGEFNRSAAMDIR